ncbi:permease prefix domain 1-containing protein [Lacrimispora sp.]|uniref:permease prefix domain 1-containing protein n=1 Tax=Lacrimispora sp. TaxID=2719234 RepID=UPI0028AC1557|nr:permease prefix domain 1-containing protein [Lacrimispora sp.]
MNKKISDSAVSHFLEEVTDQISYKPLRPSIHQELESHIKDRIEEYESQGLSHADAEHKALRGMGDAIAIGAELNEAHKIQKSPRLTFITALLLLAGFVLSCFLRWTPERMSNGFLSYIPGGILLVFTVLKGYPFVIRHRKILASFICLLYLAQIVIFFLSHFSRRRFWIASTAYFATLLLVPVITVLLYCSRHNRKKFLTAAPCCAGTWLLLMYTSGLYQISDTAAAIFLLSTLGTVCFMIHRGILSGKKKYLYSGILAFFVLLGSPLFLTPSGREKTEAFLSPQSAIHTTWDDTYNGVLIQELLSRTPLTRGLLLSPEEMMDYGTGAWYFASRDPRHIGIDATGIHTDKQLQEFQDKVEAIEKQGGSPRSIHYMADDVTLWDILPQHYHNNYLIAVCIFLFGWLPGLAIIGTIGLFYWILFSYIRRIHGNLASSLAFCCGQCLLWQGVFYLLGNFGYQYAIFPNLPLISEGQLSILLNMLLLGLVFSAYRYDHVIEEPVNYRPITSG